MQSLKFGIDLCIGKIRMRKQQFQGLVRSIIEGACEYVLKEWTRLKDYVVGNF